ncbi:hypothetical protein MNB_SV-5-1081 [hydrothermal vent metagenome]|uniref:Major outer membrane protein n=1 Tax=hydrothermal vent metagenome TaxID=652676 RepID=A0A1W1EFU5_9ZZZZ
MNKFALITIVAFTSSSFVQADVIHEINDYNTTKTEKVKIKSIRGVLGNYDLEKHSKAQVRAGYINFDQDGSPRTSSYALAGHYHVDSNVWNGMKVNLEAYTVLNVGINQNSANVNGDFFNDNGKSFILISQAYLNGKWGDTEINFGRQILDTPHADSDDIRMMPNYFEAYNISNTDIENTTLSAGFIRQMAGWENGIDASQFVNLGQTLDTKGVDIDGVAYANIGYDGIKDLSLNVWYYNYNDIANVVYADAAYNYKFSKDDNLMLAVQYDASRETGSALLGQQDANTYGISAELTLESIGIHILAAYNQDSGETGAMGLSLGGGPFFTSMEDQTLDAIGAAGSAWIIGTGYHFSAIGIDGLNAGIAYGNFKSKDSNVYESNEIDVVVEYALNDKTSLTAAYASVKFDAGLDENNQALTDYNQFRIITQHYF